MLQLIHIGPMEHWNKCCLLRHFTKCLPWGEAVVNDPKFGKKLPHLVDVNIVCARTTFFDDHPNDAVINSSRKAPLPIAVFAMSTVWFPCHITMKRCFGQSSCMLFFLLWSISWLEFSSLLFALPNQSFSNEVVCQVSKHFHLKQGQDLQPLHSRRHRRHCQLFEQLGPWCIAHSIQTCTALPHAAWKVVAHKTCIAEFQSQGQQHQKQLHQIHHAEFNFCIWISTICQSRKRKTSQKVLG